MRNPVPPSSIIKQEEAETLYKDFTGMEPDSNIIIKNPISTHGVAIGECNAIEYNTVRDGKEEYYRHDFKKTARPIISTNSDGSNIFLVDGNFRFTERGIVDEE